MPPVVASSSSSDTGNRTVRLSNGVEMPTVGFGCAGYVRKPALLEALAAGYRLFDTAQATEWYLEDELGAALAEAPHVNRSELFLTSKLHPRDLGEQPTLDAFPRSLARLRTTYLDAFLLHYPACFGSLCATPPAGTWRESWRALEALYDQGRIRALGVSNFAPSQLRELLEWARVGPHLVQSWMDPLHQERALRRLCAAHGVQFQAYSSLGTQHAGRTGGANPVLKHPAVAALAEEAGRAPAQVVLRWALQRGAAVIPRSTKPRHIAANRALHDFSLTEAQLRAVDALDGQDPVAVLSGLPPLPCADENAGCAAWAEAGECEENAAYMLVSCRGSCNACEAKVEL